LKKSGNFVFCFKRNLAFYHSFLHKKAVFKTKSPIFPTKFFFKIRTLDRR
jgi:hypothetical protein